jgi:hypothetical protein
MAIAYLAEGAVNLLTAGNWSDATGIVDNATLIIAKGSQNIVSNLDTTAAATSGVDYFHVTTGFTGSIGAAGTSFRMNFDSTYTTKPNFYWAGSGFCYFHPGLTVTTALVAAGQVFHTAGTITNLQVTGGTVNVGTSAIVTNLYAYGNGSVTVTANTAQDITLAVVSGAGPVRIERGCTTLTVTGPATVTLDLPVGETITTLNLNNPLARVVVVGADITTAEVHGKLDLSPMTRDSTIGGTATRIYPTGSVLGEGNQRVTLSNVTRIAGGSFAGAGEMGA